MHSLKVLHALHEYPRILYSSLELPYLLQAYDLLTTYLRLIMWLILLIITTIPYINLDILNAVEIIKIDFNFFNHTLDIVGNY